MADSIDDLYEAIEKAGMVRGGSSGMAARLSVASARNVRGGDARLNRATAFLRGRRKGGQGPSRYSLAEGRVNSAKRKGVYKGAVEKAKPKTLYVYRPVENAEDILAWAKGQGFKSLLPAEKLHCTIIASATEINWATLFDDYHMEPSDRPSYCECGPVYNPVEQNKSKTIEGGVREVKRLGDKGAVVLAFESLSLMQRWIDLRRAGAVSKFASFVPHLTLTLSGDVPKDITPYEGKIVLGEECWEEFKDGAYEGVEEVVTKAGMDVFAERLVALEAALAKSKAEQAKEAA